MRTRQWDRLLILAAMIAIITMIGAPGVAAHARLTASDPADKALLTKAPAQVILTFSEEVSPTKSGGSASDASGATVSTGFKVDLNARTNMAITLKPNLPNGAYTVQWNTLTEDDNGMANGRFAFTVQAAAVTSGATAVGATPAGASVVAGTVAATPTTAPATTATITATIAPTIGPTTTRSATLVATSTGSGTATASTPATLPTTGNNGSGSGAPWVMVIVVAAALIVAGGCAFRLRNTRR
ncbi:MAG: copper resistance protein CopC [Chloroflexota bacterium]|nr:copper resistance protein CopC [Chloroflexota bacterium]